MSQLKRLDEEQVGAWKASEAHGMCGSWAVSQETRPEAA